MRKFSLANMTGGVTFKEGVPIKVKKQNLINGFQAIGIDIEGTICLAHGALDIRINWIKESEEVEVKIYKIQPSRK